MSNFGGKDGSFDYEVIQKQIEELRIRHPFLALKNPALLVVDVQRFFFDRKSSVHLTISKKIFPKIEKIVKSCREKGIPVIFTRHVDEKDGPMKKWWNHVMDETCSLSELFISPENDPVIVKTSYDAFYKTELENLLRKLEVDQLLVCGVMTHLCVGSTVRSAFVRGFNPVVIMDAVGSRNDLFHLSGLVTLAHGFSTLITTGELIECLEQKSQ